MDHFAEAIGDRVRTMSAAHDLMARRPNDAVDLRTLLSVLTPDEASGRLRTSGPDCPVHPSRLRAIAMVLAELFANARRHGALRHDGAYIEIEWRRADDAEAVWRLAWTERGCSINESDPGESTGRKLVNGFARSELQGSADWSFEPDGVRFVLEFRTDVRPKPRIPHYSTRPTTQGGGAAPSRI